MTQAYTEWLKRPESERNAEAATVVMGWDLSDNDTVWCRDGECLRDVEDWSPCTDRNATDLVLAAVERRGPMVRMAFIDRLRGSGLIDVGRIELSILRAPASLLTWACVEACKKAQ